VSEAIWSSSEGIAALASLVACVTTLVANNEGIIDFAGGKMGLSFVAFSYAAVMARSWSSRSRGSADGVVDIDGV